MKPEKTNMDKPVEPQLGRKDGFFTLESCLYLPRPVEMIFPFFADAANLEVLTPPWLRFEILTPLPILMRPGAIIEYRIRLHGIPLRWMTEITAWEPPNRFVDEQRRGPYRQWIHEHTFTPRGDGTEMRDFVRYKVPGGRLVHFFFVRPDVRKIFAYRALQLQKLVPGTDRIPERRAKRTWLPSHWGCARHFCFATRAPIPPPTGISCHPRPSPREWHTAPGSKTESRHKFFPSGGPPLRALRWILDTQETYLDLTSSRSIRI